MASTLGGQPSCALPASMSRLACALCQRAFSKTCVRDALNWTITTPCLTKQLNPQALLKGKKPLKDTLSESIGNDTNLVRASSTTKNIPERIEEESSLFCDPLSSGNAIRKRFLDFFASRGHTVLPGSSLVPDDPTVLLTIAGMLQFKPVFLGQVPRQVLRATTSQKCLRTNDIENVGRTSRHHTFFEMLGNFSFGDYFKVEAIQWAWELATVEFKLPKERIWVSVFEDDEESYLIWRDKMLMPESRIKRMGTEDNFWASGPTGPCGPCSEMYYDFCPELGILDADLGDGNRFLEFYNLVFMQYNRTSDGVLEPLKQKNIDTGLGLERMARILQKVPNNYETDLIFPIISRAAGLANINYKETNDRMQTFLKIIGDHTRAVVYLISDGVTPSNTGRGYIVRRLIRRIVRTGRLLGIKGDGEGNSEGAFLPILAEVVVHISSGVDLEVRQNARRIYEELHREETRFVQTLERGERLLEDLLVEAMASGNSKPCLLGKDVFTLYDTYGFPVDITAEVAAERGVLVDLTGFEKEMEVQRKQSQIAHNVIELSAGDIISELSSSLQETEFLGYSLLQANAVVVTMLVKGHPVQSATTGDEVQVILDRTPFYAESGGQIADRGLLQKNIVGDRCIMDVQDVQKTPANLFLHRCLIKEGSICIGEKVQAFVRTDLRQQAQIHHTATHLLQAALKEVLGDGTSQAGSLVAFDRLRFDFNLHRPMTENELAKTELMVNKWIGMSVPLQSEIMALEDAKKAGAIAMFGEKYGEQVRVISVPGISMELCGGTHVGNTSDIRGFKIISEQGIASGIRRIEAVGGSAFVEHVTGMDRIIKQLTSSLKVKAEELPSRISSLQEEVKRARNVANGLRAEIAKAKADVLISSKVAICPSGVRVVVASIDMLEAESLKVAAEYMREHLGDPSAILLGSSKDGRVNLVAAFSPQLVERGLRACNFIGDVAKMCGGGGGGRPDFAQAGGRLPGRLNDALHKADHDLKAICSTLL